MKKINVFMVMMALLSMTSCNTNGSADSNAQQGTEIASTTEQCDAFEAFAAHFSETASFAYANVGDRKVLLVSHETFGNNVNDSIEAIDATIFVQDPDGKIKTLGSIRSQGTLYPVSILDGKLMVAGHQFVRIYSIKGDVPELFLDSYQEGDGPELTAMYEMFEKGNAILFKKSLKE